MLNIIVRAFKDRNYIYRVSERFGIYPKGIEGEVIWVHAVSFGEVKAASPLVRELIKAYPSKKILFTCTTPTGSKLIKDLFSEEVINVYLPYDLKGSVSRFFRWANPQIAIVVETEIWPNLYSLCEKNDTKIIIINARFNTPKGILRILSNKIYKETLNKVTHIYCKSKKD